MDMEVEEEMELVTFEAREVDPDYEFDAAMFFDFSHDESPAEARAAEIWFETARSYPPSPFVAKLVMRESIYNNSSPKSTDMENTTSLIADDDLGPELPEIELHKKECGGVYRGITAFLQNYNPQNVSNQPLGLTTELTFQSQISTDKYKGNMKSTFKSNFPRKSTLMKPTASMLAKQNRPPYVSDSRFQTLLVEKERTLCNSSVVETQASKRQKLEGGHLPKVNDAKQQNDFIHKAPKKDVTVDKIYAHAKLRITIPREPALQTANRAQRMRPPKDSTEPEHMTVTARRFKARPLNRKILEAPSLPLPKKSIPKLPEFQEFHLKTLERAMQHTSSFSSSWQQCNDRDKVTDKPSSIPVADNVKTESRRPGTTDESVHDRYSSTNVFKARPLNKKIFSSKGDIGVFRNSKRETTVPVEFNFHTERRIQHNPPVELFSKLSLTSELHPNNGSQLQSQRSNTSMKGSKENRLNPLQTEHEVTYLAKEWQPGFGGKQIQPGSNGIHEVGNHSIMRHLGIR